MKTHDRYADQDVIFISLTEESNVESIDAWAQRVELPWSIGYGAGVALKALEVPGFPTTLVIGRDGNVVWHRFLSGSLDSAIRKAL